MTTTTTTTTSTGLWIFFETVFRLASGTKITLEIFSVKIDRRTGKGKERDQRRPRCNLTGSRTVTGHLPRFILGFHTRFSDRLHDGYRVSHARRHSGSRPWLKIGRGSLRRKFISLRPRKSPPPCLAAATTTIITRTPKHSVFAFDRLVKYLPPAFAYPRVHRFVHFVKYRSRAETAARLFTAPRKLIRIHL